MGLEDLGSFLKDTIFTKLEPRELAILSCVSSRLRVAASEDIIWRHFCTVDFDLLYPEDPDGRPCPSFKVAYGKWMKSFSMYPLPLVKRANQLFIALKRWVAANFREIIFSLRSGATEQKIRKAEKELDVQFPMSTRILYRFCDGQNGLILPNSVSTKAPSGIIGGYVFNDHSANVQLLPLDDVVKSSILCRYMTSMPRGHAIVAMSEERGKFFYLNCLTDQLYVGSKLQEESELGKMIPCVPIMQEGALMLWLEEHRRRLDRGIIQTRIFRGVRSIWLYPCIRRSQTDSLYSEALLPCCSIAATNGVQVYASTIFVPELSTLVGETEYKYSYSISMSLLPEDCFLNGISYSSRQLSSWHWIIRPNDIVVADEIGVVGQYPCLTPDNKKFTYEGCITLREASGSVEGFFTFVPGRLDRPEGAPFQVKLAPFILDVPEFIY